MSDWSIIDAAANAIMQETFGEPVVYQSAQAAMAVGDPVTITAIRYARVREESGALANVEEISVNPADLSQLPATGRLGHRLGIAIRSDHRAPTGSLRAGRAFANGASRADCQ